MLQFVFELVSLYFASDMVKFWFFPFVALLFLVTVPFLIRSFLRG